MIDKHKFSDVDLSGATYFGDDVFLIIRGQTNSISLQKRDVEALANHFDLIPAPPTYKEKEA
jgi:hypothetical protein